MPVFAFYVQKSTPFMGEDRPFGNTYHFEQPEGISNPALNDILRELIDVEKSICVNEVDFFGGKSWGPTDGDAFDNVMRTDFEIDEEGDLLENFQSYREACLNIRWPLPRSQATNSKRWLRKYLRMAGTASMPTDAVQGFAAIPEGDVSTLVTNYVNRFTGPNAEGSFGGNLCTADGVEATDPGTVMPYYITRQIGS